MRSPLLRADVVRRQRGLIADVQAAIADDWMRPARQPLIGDPKPTLFLVARGTGLRESDDVVFALYIKVAVGERERAFADAAVAPHHLAGRKFQACEDRVVEAVQVPVH